MLFKVIYIVFISVLFVSCKKHGKEINQSTPSELKNGMLVLCEGLFQHNNSSLSWVDFETSKVDDNFFVSKCSRELGDTGNDLKIYGGKIYIVVNVSSTIEVLDKFTGLPVKQISMQNGSKAKQPRSIVFKGSNAFITCYDGYVDVLDTLTLTITKRIKVGANPERMSVLNNKLYVTNSGGLNAPNVDSTVSVINLTTLLEDKKIVVGKNPGSIVADNQGDMYVIARGNYGSTPSRMVKINTVNDSVESHFSFNASGIEKMNDDFLISYFDYSTNQSTIALFNTISEQITNANFISTTSIITTLFGVKYNSYQNKIYCLDGMGYSSTGYVRVFSSHGAYEKSYHVGLNPNSIVFYD